MFASRALCRRGVRNLSPLGDSFGEVRRCRVTVRFVAHDVVLGRWMWEDEIRMKSLRRRSDW